MDEVEYAIRGKVDDWRIQRDFTYGIMLSSGNYKNPPDRQVLFPLTFDEELNAKLSADDITALYDKYKGVL